MGRNIINIGTWNIGSLSEKLMEIADIMAKSKIKKLHL